MIFRRYNVLFLAYFLSEKNMCWGGIIFYQANIPSGIKVGLKSEISATDEWKSEISATDGGNRRFLLRMVEIRDFCYGWGKSEISTTDGGNRRFLLRDISTQWDIDTLKPHFHLIFQQNNLSRKICLD